MKHWIVVVAVVGFAGACPGAEPSLVWPRFRGPDGSGVAEGQKPPVKFGPGENVRWKIAVPEGLSSPIVAGDNLVLTGFDGGKLYTIAYRRTDGKEAWRREAPAKQVEKFFKGEGSPAASTPATDGRRIVSYFGSCGLICYDLAGQELWRFPMATAVTWANFGSGVSPILADGTVVLVRDELEASRIVAVGLADGKLRWERSRQSKISYASPVVWDTPAGKQVVVAGLGRMIGYDLKTGGETWFVAGMPTGPCASPVVAGGTLYFAGWSPGGADDPNNQFPTFDSVLKDADTDKDGALSRAEAEKTFLKDMFDSLDANKDGKVTRAEWDMLVKMLNDAKNSAFAVSPGGKGDVSDSHVLWRKKKGLPYVATSIVYGGQLVMVKDGGLVSAYDAKTGAEVYVQERAAASGKYYSSPVAANGHIYFISLEDGGVTVLKAGTAKPEVAAKNPKLGERVSATPAIADDTLYVRTEGHLYAFGAPK